MLCRTMDRWRVVCVGLLILLGATWAGRGDESPGETVDTAVPGAARDDAESTKATCEPEPVSAVTEAASWIQDDLRRSLNRAALLCERFVPAWPSPRFERIDAKPLLEGGRGVLHGMQRARDPAIRMRAMEALGETGGPDDLDVCLASLADPVAAVRRTAAEAVARLCQRPGNSHLAEQLLMRVFHVFSQWDIQRRSAFDAALPQWASVLCASARHALESDETKAGDRAVAAYCLGRMGCLEASAVLATFARNEDKKLAREAARALYRLRAPESTRTWVDLVRETDPMVQRIAVQALAAQGDSVALSALTSIAMGEGELPGTVQILATNALAAWPREAAVPALLRALYRNPTVRRYAGARLRAITGLNMGDMPEEWRAWYETGKLPAGVSPPRRGGQVRIEAM